MKTPSSPPSIFLGACYLFKFSLLQAQIFCDVKNFALLLADFLYAAEVILNLCKEQKSVIKHGSIYNDDGGGDDDDDNNNNNNNNNNNKCSAERIQLHISPSGCPAITAYKPLMMPSYSAWLTNLIRVNR